MKAKILKAKDYSYSDWAGGSTQQLLLLPVDASFAKRDFEVRISKATIKAAKSTFTLLPGINRNLLLLSGQTMLHINKELPQLVLPGSEINFSGSDQITCQGSGSDFNVMHAGEGHVSSQFLQFKKSNILHFITYAVGQILFIYANQGSLKIEIDQDKFELKEDQCLFIPSLIAKKELRIEANKNSNAVLSEIWLDK